MFTAPEYKSPVIIGKQVNYIIFCIWRSFCQLGESCDIHQCDNSGTKTFFNQTAIHRNNTLLDFKII